MTKISNTDSIDLVADWSALERIFIRPEASSRETLVKYMEQILFGLHEFLNKNVGITEQIDLKALAGRYSDTLVNNNPEKKLSDVITSIIEDIAPKAVNVASPYFIGHMTSAIPFFMVHLKSIVAALNQNVIKLETSKVLSIVERQVLAKVHRLLYGQNEAFYRRHVQSINTTLGAFTEGGTTANITALWVARNLAFKPKEGFDGVEREGVAAAFEAYGVKRAVVLVSKRGHYSIRKAGGVLGIGNKNIIPIDVDQDNKLDIDCLKDAISRYDADLNTRIIAVVGIAGTTETGNVDPLEKIANVCVEHGIHFHVDAAWGGPVVVSKKYRHLLRGIELADSITIDGHKQFYMPMSCGMIYFKDPCAMDAIAYYANYVNRENSVDLGIKSLSGSREADSLVLDGALKIMGTNGYALLIDHGIGMAKSFAREIDKRPQFQMMTWPELNILTYRFVPEHLGELLQTGTVDEKNSINVTLNAINKSIQQIQRERGKSFVSRTVLTRSFSGDMEMVVFRCAIMNPMTHMRILNQILDEQESIYESMV